MRIEKDSLGNKEIKIDAVYGINSIRSFENFPDSGEKIHPLLIKSYFLVKLAALETNYNCNLIDQEKYLSIKNAINSLLEETDSAVKGQSLSIYDKIIVDPYQGGAGTSLNMNVNEVIANTALKISCRNYGEYSFIHPIDHINLSQSTNDTFITAFKIASIILLRELTDSFANLQNAFQQKEEEFRSVIKLGRTELQDAVPITLGQEFGAYAQAVARDRWRLYNAEERLRSVNMGGTAIGNSVSASNDYVLKINSILKKITKLPIAKSEDLIDATQNLDVFIEVHGMIKAGAASIQKISNDLRLISSGPKGGFGEITLPPLQSGSSIMPGKINPVMLEYAIQISELVKGNDVTITNLVAAGNLELNAFLPMISHLFLKSVTLLSKSNSALAEKCILGIKANKEKCKEHLMNSNAISAYMINKFGYDEIQETVKFADRNKISFVESLKRKTSISQEEIDKILSIELGI